jgi:hypothetical protein
MKKAGNHRRLFVISTTAGKGFVAKISVGKRIFTTNSLRLCCDAMPETSIEASIKATTRYTRLFDALIPTRAIKIVETIKRKPAFSILT